MGFDKSRTRQAINTETMRLVAWPQSIGRRRGDGKPESGELVDTIYTILIP